MLPPEPATTVLLLTATEPPNVQYDCVDQLVVPSDGFNLAVSVMFVQPLLGSTNTYTSPCGTPLTFLNGAPTTTVLPLMATAWPNESPAAPSDAVSCAAKVDVVLQPVTGFRNM